MAMELLRDIEITPLLPGAGHSYRLELSDTGKRDGLSKHVLAYKFTEIGTGRVLFEGADFSASPMHATDSAATICALLGFLTTRYEEDGKSDIQRAWTYSVEAEVISGMVWEIEADPDSETTGQWADMVKDL